jgi:hypothetical protein
MTDDDEQRSPRDPRIDPFPGDKLRKFSPFSEQTFLVTVIEVKRDPNDKRRLWIMSRRASGHWRYFLRS